jgi:hypothetical protein
MKNDHKKGGTGFLFIGGSVEEQRKASASRALAMTLRPGNRL